MQEQSSVSDNNAPQLIRGGQESQEFLSLSLFDPQVLLNQNEEHNYEYTWQNHIQNTTGIIFFP